MSEYSEKLKNPQWQKKRLQILSRDDFTCQRCLDKETTLHVHHRVYVRGQEPWEYPDGLLVTLCETCHKEEWEDGSREKEHIIDALQRFGFLSGDLNELAVGFESSTLKEKPALVAVIFSHILSDPDLFDAIEEQFTEFINKAKTSVPQNGQHILPNPIKTHKKARRNVRNQVGSASATLQDVQGIV